MSMHPGRPETIPQHEQMETDGGEQRATRNEWRWYNDGMAAPPALALATVPLTAVGRGLGRDVV